MAKTPKPVTTRSVLKKSRTGWHFLEVSATIAKRFETSPKTRRVVCTLNETHTFQCALSPNKGVYTIGVSVPARNKLALVEGDEVTIRIEADTSRYGAPMPEDFAEVLKQDPEGSRLFHALTGGMQRSLLYYIGNVKNLDRRIELGLIVLQHLKDNGGKLVADRLQDDVKRPLF